jgi:hypothetical protein
MEALAELSDLLWRERELLEVLLFKLETEQVLLVAGRTRWLARATHEVEIVVEELRKVELRRAIVVDGVALSLGVPGEQSLHGLAQQAPAPWDGLLRDHRMAFLTLTREVQTVADGNKVLLAQGYRSTREALLVEGDREDSYDRRGHLADQGGRSRLVNEAV